MSVWAVTNGWMGNGDVTALVEGDDEATAVEAARELFRAEGEKWDQQYPQMAKGEKYWSHLSAERLELPTIVELG